MQGAVRADFGRRVCWRAAMLVSCSIETTLCREATKCVVPKKALRTRALQRHRFPFDRAEYLRELRGP